MRPNLENENHSTRRTFLRTTGQIAAVTSLAAMTIPSVHAAENNTIQLAIIGVGGRGKGAVANALRPANGQMKLVAMADVFQKHIEEGVHAFKKFDSQFDCPKERQFVGFDAYKQAMDCLKPGDVVILTTPLAFRTVHFAYAIKKGLNVFMEKPLTADGPKSREMLKLGKESIEKNLKVGVGLMCRHCEVRGELYKKLRNGDLGELILLRANRIAGDTASAYSKPRKVKDSPSELLWQISRFHSFLWASGGAFSDFMIHNIDECCWMKDAWPVSALGLGGRTNRGEHVDQNFDNYTIDYTFADGTKLICEGRYLPGCTNDFASYAHGTKGMAVISTSGHAPAKSRIYSSQNPDAKNLVWKGPDKERNPYDLEWEHLIDAIRNDKPYNEVERGVQASVVTAMGRMSAHTGQKITFDEMLNSEHEFAPNIDKFTMDGPAPVLADKDGKYPIPLPGIKASREY